jgi:hypothetical protein
VAIDGNRADGNWYQDYDGTWSADPQLRFFPNERIGQRIALMGLVGKISAYDVSITSGRFGDKPEGLPADFIIISSSPTADGISRLPTRCVFDDALDDNDAVPLASIVWYYEIEVGDLITVIGDCAGIIDDAAVLTSCCVLGSHDLGGE